MCENPKQDKARLARVIYVRHGLTEASHRAALASMCDTTWIDNPSRWVAANARVFRHVYLKADSPPALVDEWDLPAPRVAAVAVVYCTADRLLRWAGAMAIRDAQVEAARRELHEHVQRMDAFFKAQLGTEAVT